MTSRESIIQFLNIRKLIALYPEKDAKGEQEYMDMMNGVLGAMQLLNTVEQQQKYLDEKIANALKQYEDPSFQILVGLLEGEEDIISVFERFKIIWAGTEMSDERLKQYILKFKLEVVVEAEEWNKIKITDLLMLCYRLLSALRKKGDKTVVNGTSISWYFMRLVKIFVVSLFKKDNSKEVEKMRLWFAPFVGYIVDYKKHHVYTKQLLYYDKMLKEYIAEQQNQKLIDEDISDKYFDNKEPEDLEFDNNNEDEERIAVMNGEIDITVVKGFFKFLYTETNKSGTIFLNETLVTEILQYGFSYSTKPKKLYQLDTHEKARVIVSHCFYVFLMAHLDYKPAKEDVAMFLKYTFKQYSEMEIKDIKNEMRNDKPRSMKFDIDKYL